MSTDVVHRLRVIDPADVPVTPPEDLLAALVAQPRGAAAPGRAARRARLDRRRRVALAGACAVAGAAAAVALPGGASRAPDARAALFAAAERTAAFTSGEITWHTVHRPPVSDFPTDNVLVTRYDGRDSSTRFVASGEHAGPPSEVRVVDGGEWLRIADGPWRAEPRPDPGAAPTRARFDDALQVAAALADIAHRAPDVRSEPRGADTVYHATIDATALPRFRTGGPEWPAGPVAVDVTVTADGTVGEMDLHVPAQRWDVSFARLGEPQGIAAP
jgi:hypothetical protein